jgi:hypothetical protein
MVNEVAARSNQWQSDNPDIAKKSLPSAAMHSMSPRFDRKSKQAIMGRLWRSTSRPEPLKLRTIFYLPPIGYSIGFPMPNLGSSASDIESFTDLGEEVWE